MSKISIVFGAITVPEQDVYLKQRISLLHAAGSQMSGSNSLSLSKDLLAGYISGIVQAGENEATMPLAETIDVSTIQGENAAELRNRKTCMLNEVGSFFPLVDGEHPITNEVSYLAADWEGFPSLAVVLRQTTNFSTCFYIYPEVQVDMANRQLVEQGMEDTEMAMMLTDVSINIDFGEVARQLSMGLTGGLPSPMDKIGAKLLSIFWPAPDRAAQQWREMYDTLQVIVRNGLAENNIIQARQKLHGFVLFLNNSYQPLADDTRVTRKERLDALTPYDTVFFLDIVNVFMFTEPADLGLAIAVLANFMTGACLHIGLNQERALQDPNNTDASNSPYAKTVSNLAKVYGDYAKKTAPAIKARRMEQIDKEVRHDSKSHCRGGGGASCSTTHTFWFQDSNNGFRSPTFSHSGGGKRPPDSRGNATRALQEHRERISASMDALLKTQVYDVVENWNKLLTNPIPIK